MRVFRRVTDILSASLNDLIDKFEDPEKMLRQAIREMEESVADAMDAAARAIATEKLLEKDLEKHEGDACASRERAEKAVEAGNDALARVALRIGNDGKKAAEGLRKDLEAARVANQALRRQIDALRAKLAEAKRKLAALSARKRVSDARKKVLVVGKNVNAGPFCKFDRLRKRIEEDEAAVDALASLACDVTETAGVTAAAAAEASAADLAIEEDLAQLKRRLRA